MTAVYLFGSRAEGRAHSENDVDVGVLLSWSKFSTRSGRFDERVRLSAWISGELGLADIDLVADLEPFLRRTRRTKLEAIAR